MNTRCSWENTVLQHSTVHRNKQHTSIIKGNIVYITRRCSVTNGTDCVQFSRFVIFPANLQFRVTFLLKHPVVTEKQPFLKILKRYLESSSKNSHFKAKVETSVYCWWVFTFTHHTDVSIHEYDLCRENCINILLMKENCEFGKISFLVVREYQRKIGVATLAVLILVTPFGRLHTYHEMPWNDLWLFRSQITNKLCL